MSIETIKGISIEIITDEEQKELKGGVIIDDTGMF